jgi:hypothetical protein
MGRRKQVFQITFPNGKIYVGSDTTGTVLAALLGDNRH